MILPLVPQPVTVQPLDGTFQITAETAVIRPENADAARVAEFLAEALRTATGFAIPVAEEGTIGLELVDRGLEGEAHEIITDWNSLRLQSGTAEGLFRAVQTIRQLLIAPADTADADADAADTSRGWTIPGILIEDRPRYPYRSAMLDVARHFFPVAEVKRFIDAIAAYKLNHLHLHLSDDQGWRIEIPSRPELTAKASHFEVGGGPGGFYTVQDYAEIVRYAADRFITIVPEIDVPGHSNAAILAYPELGPDWFTAAPYTETEVGFSTLAHDREETYTFLADVFGDIAAMTPGPYLHIGADEVDKLTPEEFDVFVRRAAEIAAATGKTVIGWEEVVGTGVPSTVIAQYWGRSNGVDATHGVGDEPFRQAMRTGTKAIVSPASRSYLDMKYDATSPLGNDWAGTVDVRQAYEWDPAEFIGDIPPENVLGVEAPLWTESIKTFSDAEYLVFPRLAGIAEIGWSPAGRDWDEYRIRIAAHGAWWTTQGRDFFRAPEIWD